MKNKDKRINEFEEELQYNNRVWFLLWIVTVIVASILIFFSGLDNTNLKQQLQSCQEKVDVWTLEYKCVKSESVIISVQRNFSNFENYNDNKIYFDRQENCEVIK